MRRHWIAPLLCLSLAVQAAPSREERALQALADAQTVKLTALQLGELDYTALAKQDAIDDKIAGLPFRFAVPFELGVNAKSDGHWSVGKDGRAIWRQWIEGKGAAHLNFGFTRFELPASAELVIVAGDGHDLLGPYSAKDRLEHGQLWTPILYGERALIELRVDAKERDQVVLELGTVGHGYRGFGVKSIACKSGACNTDVACLASDDPWNQPRRSAGGYSTGGSNICSGALINNTRNDGRMLFATASHCGITSNSAAASVVVYWNYESPTCRTPGSGASGVPVTRPSSTTQGLRFLAATDAINSGAGSTSTRSDWTLIELATPPAGNNFNLFWAGWDRAPPPTSCTAPANRNSTSGLCASIHHPSGDEKRITFVEATMGFANYGSAAIGLHWDAPWDPTPPFLANISPTPTSLPPSVTEPGSSGSPLFNADRRLIGVLSGGPSACGATGAALRDYYGGLFHAWEGLGTATTRVKDYLDPTNSGVMRIDGRSAAALTVSATIPGSTSAGGTVELSASASGGSGPFTYEWDTDGDGVYETRSSSAQLRVSYPRAGSYSPSVRVTDANGIAGATGRTLTVAGPQINASANGAATQVCGNNDSKLDPGERWQLPVRLQNSGSGGMAAGHSLFVTSATGSELELPANTFGYRGTRQADQCGFGYVDLATGAFASPLLGTTGSDDARTSTITLGGNGVLLYGQRYTQAVMSTNGYVSFDSNESGGDYDNSCSGSMDRGAVGPQLRPLHDDLVITGSGGLRYRYFDSCPRPGESGGSQGCHVFQWNSMGLWTGATPAGAADFQAIAYANTGQVVYQYRTPDALNGGGATVGLNDPSGADPFNASCNVAGSIAANQAVCLYAPGGLPPQQSAAFLPAPVQAHAALGSGQSSSFNLPFVVKRDAACGAPLAIRHIASADSELHSNAFANVFETSVGTGCAVVSGCDNPPPALADTPRRGLYFSADRPGNGLSGGFYENGNRQQFFAGLWYTATTDRSSVWYQTYGDVNDYGGEILLQRVDNAAAPNGLAPDVVDVGRAWVGQIDDDSLLFAWQFNDGRAGVERMDTVPLPFPQANHTQAWFNTEQSGWGLAIESIADGSAAGYEFFAVYLYDASGAPRWLVGDKTSTGSGSSNLFDYPAHCPGCPWLPDYESGAKAGGSMTINYSARNRATLSTNIVLPAPLSGSWIRNNLPIVPVDEPRP